MLEKHFYCVKCHAGKTVVGQSPIVLKNGATALKGKCPSCESMAYKIVSKDALRTELRNRAKAAIRANALLLSLSTFVLGLLAGIALAFWS